MLYGVDISNHQGRANWDVAATTGGVRFALVKATEGVSFDDAWFARNWSELGRLGLPRGAYHYALPSENSWQAEAEHFLAAIGKVGLQPGDLVALDMEDPAYPVGRDVSVWTLQWLRAVEDALGFAPLLYTYPSYKTERKLTDPALARYPLWWAAYDEPERYPTTPWLRWAIRQYTAEETVAGLGSRIDCNHFAGDEAALRALGKPGVVALTETTGDPPSPIVTPATDWGTGSRGDVVARFEAIVAVNAGHKYLGVRINGNQLPWQEL